jgi:hypothetical protein
MFSELKEECPRPPLSLLTRDWHHSPPFCATIDQQMEATPKMNPNRKRTGN